MEKLSPNLNKAFQLELFFFARGQICPDFFCLCYFLAGAAGKKRAKKKVQAKSGQKKRWCGQKAGKKRINIHRSLLIYFAAIAPPLPSIKSHPTFAAIRQHLRRHLPPSAAVHSTLPSVAVLRLFPLSIVQHRSPPSSTHRHHPPLTCPPPTSAAVDDPSSNP
jgi:hypothetical protein